MQVHTGEHILSGVLHTLYGATNVGFHLGETEVTLDLDIPLTEEELAAAEEAANRAIFEDRAVRILYPAPAELGALDYRAKPALTEGVRLVEIEGVDLCACCAPHVARTGECGLVKIVSHMKYKGGTRLSIAVGADALADYRKKQENVRAVSVALSVPEAEIADGVARLQKALAEERGVLSALRAALRAERLSSLADGDSVLLYPDLDAGALRLYAEEGAGRTSGTVLVLLEVGDGCRYAMASRTSDVKARAAALHARLGGRGGGHSSLVQGSFAASAEAVRTAFSEV
jgi:alanyl-tRNA synthetase